MTVEELEIIVTAKVEEAIKQFKKIVPEIRKVVQQTQEIFEKMDTKVMTNKVKQVVELVKNKIEDLKKSNQNNQIKLIVNNKDARKQISQIQKEIDSLQEKINARQIKLNITNNALDKMGAETNQEVIKEMPGVGNKEIKQETYNRLNNNSDYISLIKESDKLNNEIIKYNSLLETAKQQMSNLGNVVKVFTNAWNYNGNGVTIIQNLSNALNNLLVTINNVVASERFQNWINNCSDKFREISEKISEINWQPLINALSDIGQNLGNIALDILSGLIDIFKWLVENPIVAEIIASIAIALSIVSTVLGIISGVLTILNPIVEVTKIQLLPLIGIILGIIAVIALIVLAITNWDTIMNFLKQTVEIVINAVVEFFTNLWNQVSFIFNAIWEVLSTILGFIWNMFSTVFQAIWNIVSPIINAIWQIISTIFQAIWNILSSILGSIWNIFSQIFNWIWQLTLKVFQGIWDIISPIINKVWETIKFVLGKIQEIWSAVWNTISNVINRVWNAIWGTIRNVINNILGGIEKFVNGTIKGINKLLSGISSVANAIGSLIGIDPINLQISTISLPRLAKGGVLKQPMAVLAGEYAGARSNPEIVTPQNIMYDTMRRAIEDTEFHNSNNGQTINLTVKVGNKKLGQMLLDDLRDMTRQTGKDIEALVGG